MEYLVLGLLAIGIPIAWTAAFFMALGARSRLQMLERRFGALERRLALAGGPAADAAAAQAASPEGGPVLDDLVRRAGHGESEPTPETPAAVPESPATEEPPTKAGREPARPPRSGLEVFAPKGGAAPPAPPPGAAAAAAPAGPGLEERLGTRWVVWVGGLALALGAVFLVRYSIEQGLIGPGARIVLGALFAAALIAAGEWTRRKEVLTGIAGLPTASIPAILTAAGTMAAFATVWAAHGLYGFIGPAAAFVLLGAVALATLAAALLHGPTLAGLGLVGAYLAPALITSPEPNFWALYLYLAIVTAAAFALARMRLWRWLAITAVVLSILWILPGLGVVPPGADTVYVVILFALAGAMLVSGFAFGPPARPDAVDGMSSAALAAVVAAAALVVVDNEHHALPLFAFAALTAATVAIAWRAPAATAAVPAAALIAAFVIVEWAVQVRFETLLAPGGPVARDAPGPTYANVGTHLMVGSGFAALFGGAGFLAQGRAGRPIIPILWAAAAVIAPLAILVALYYRVSGFERSIPFAGLALLLAALYATATEILSRRTPRPGSAASSALFAVGGVAGLALALTMALEKGFLTVALALMVPGVAMIADKRPMKFLRWLAAGAAVLVCARIGWDPRIAAEPGATPVFNWLLWGYGVPAAAFWLGGHLLRRRRDDLPSRMIDAAAVLFTVLTLVMQVRHIMTGGDIYAVSSRFAEVGLQASALLAVAIGLEWVRGRTRSIVHNAGAVIAAVLALLLVILLLTGANPLLHRESVGGLFFNQILIGYGIPAVLAIVLALVAMETRPMAYRAVAAAASVTLTLAYLTLEVRRFFQGPVLHHFRPTSDAEWWTYSAVWLGFGVVLLAVGLVIRSQPARLASAVVIFLTVLKVFLSDLAAIGGIWRALSFIGLGVVLMGIGWLYQRLLFPPRPPQPQQPPPPGTETEPGRPA